MKRQLAALYYGCLRGRPIREAAERFAVEALSAGEDGPALRELAGGAGDLDRTALVGLVEQAAREVGASLPEPTSRARWLARVADEIDPRPRSTQDRYDDLFAARVEELQVAARTRDCEFTRRFLEHLEDTWPDDYDGWLAELSRRCDALADAEADARVGRVAKAMTNVLHGSAYGAIEDAHVETLRAVDDPIL